MSLPMKQQCHKRHEHDMDTETPSDHNASSMPNDRANLAMRGCVLPDEVSDLRSGELPSMAQLVEDQEANMQSK